MNSKPFVQVQIGGKSRTVIPLDELPPAIRSMLDRVGRHLWWDIEAVCFGSQEARMLLALARAFEGLYRDRPTSGSAYTAITPLSAPRPRPEVQAAENALDQSVRALIVNFHRLVQARRSVHGAKALLALPKSYLPPEAVKDHGKVTRLAQRPPQEAKPNEGVAEGPPAPEVLEQGPGHRPGVPAESRPSTDNGHGSASGVGILPVPAAPVSRIPDLDLEEDEVPSDDGV